MDKEQTLQICIQQARVCPLTLAGRKAGEIWIDGHTKEEEMQAHTHTHTHTHHTVVPAWAPLDWQINPLQQTAGELSQRKRWVGGGRAERDSLRTYSEPFYTSLFCPHELLFLIFKSITLTPAAHCWWRSVMQQHYGCGMSVHTLLKGWSQSVRFLNFCSARRY